MKTLRAILSGVIVWVLIFSLFVTLSFIPIIKDIEAIQYFIVFISIFPFAVWGTTFHYKTGDQTSGLQVGIVMICTALLLDALITVPLVEIPIKGSSYFQFFTNPILWLLVVENVAVVYYFWKLRLKNKYA